MRTKILVVMVAAMVPGVAAFAQESAVTGRVTSVDGGSPVSGATVTVQRTGIRVLTDGQGRYRIEAAADDTLRFEYVGYGTESVGVAGRSVIDVALEVTAFRLDELVVTALGRERERQALGYSVQEVSGANLEKSGEANLLSSLTGRVAGLAVYNPTGLFETPEYSLRGSKPLIVVDDVPMETAFWEISADDIENVSVLKGTSASALYGSRGKDGAILITTRKGGGSVGHSITYNSSTLFQTGFTAIPEIQTQYGAGNSGQYAFRDGRGGGIFDGAGWIWGPKLDVQDPSTPSGFKELPQYDGPIDPATGERLSTPWVSRGANNLENFLRTGLTTTHSLSIANTLDNGYYRASLSHMYQNGQVQTTHLNRTTFSLSGGYELSEALQADAFWSYGRVYTPNYPRLGYGPQNYVYNLLLWMGPDVDVRDLRSYWQDGKEDIQQKHYNYAWYNNPYFLAYENRQGYYEDINYGKLSLQYGFSPDLNLMIRTGARQSSLTEDQADPLSLIRYDDPTNGNYIVETKSTLNVNTDILLDYRRQLNPDFEIRTALGANSMWDERTEFYARTMGLSVPGLYNLTNSAAGIVSSNLREKKRTNSLFGGVDAAYRDMLFVGITGRNDWSSALPPQNNSFFYPSVSAAAVVSDLLNLSRSMPYIKLRASWARVSSDPPIYSTTPVYEQGVDWNGTPSVRFPETILNPDIHPETSTTVELGSEIRLPNNRLGLDVTYYRTSDINDIFAFPISRASGFGFRLVNANEYERKGWEVTLDASPVRLSNGLSWDLLLNWSRHRRYLVDLPEGVAELGGVRPGERMDVVRTSAFARSPDGQIIYAGGFPTADPTSKVFGYYDPAWVAGVFSDLRYGNVGFSFQLDGRYKGMLFSETIQKMWWGGVHPGTVTRWRDDENEGLATYVGDGVVVVSGDVVRDEAGNIVEDNRVFAPNEAPVFWSSWINSYYHGAVAEANLYDGTFVKLREVGLTYRLPPAWAGRLRASSASVTLVGRNLWLWSKIQYIDPDGVIRWDALQTPSPRNVGFNVNVVF